MFNEYLIYQMMKFRQEEIDRTAQEAWRGFVDPLELVYSEELSITTAHPCCQCACG